MFPQIPTVHYTLTQNNITENYNSRSELFRESFGTDIEESAWKLWCEVESTPKARCDYKAFIDFFNNNLEQAIEEAGYVLDKEVQ